MKWSEYEKNYIQMAKMQGKSDEYCINANLSFATINPSFINLEYSLAIAAYWYPAFSKFVIFVRQSEKNQLFKPVCELNPFHRSENA